MGTRTSPAPRGTADARSRSPDFETRTRELAERLAGVQEHARRLEHKRRCRARDEQLRPLQSCRETELARSYECFFGPDPSYHEARRRFGYKLPATVLARPAPAIAGGSSGTR